MQDKDTKPYSIGRNTGTLIGPPLQSVQSSNGLSNYIIKISPLGRGESLVLLYLSKRGMLVGQVPVPARYPDPNIGGTPTRHARGPAYGRDLKRAWGREQS